MKIIFGIIFTVALFPFEMVQSQTIEEEFHRDIKRIYGFSPKDLTSSQKDKKSNELDQFWKYVTENKNQLLPLLKRELLKPENTPFFKMDGGSLLISITNDTSDVVFAFESMAKSDLDELSHYEYLKYVNKYASKGYDVSNAALRILDYPKFRAFVYRHGNFQLDQETAMFFAFVPMKEKYYLNKLINRAATENNDTSMVSLMTALWLTSTDEGEKTIEEIRNRPNNSKIIVDYLTELDERNKDDKPGFFSLFKTYDYDKLKQERMQLMDHISDEVLYEFYPMSKKIRTAYYISKKK